MALITSRVAHFFCRESRMNVKVLPFSIVPFIYQTAAKFTAGGLGDIGSAMKDGMMNLGSETKDLFGFAPLFFVCPSF